MGKISRTALMIVGAAILSLSLLWLTAQMAVRVSTWLFGHPGGDQGRIAVFAALCFLFAGSSVVRRRRTRRAQARIAR